jgi:hypothetical protein
VNGPGVPTELRSVVTPQTDRPASCLEDRPIASSRLFVARVIGSLTVGALTFITHGCSKPLVADSWVVEVPLIDSSLLIVEASHPGSTRPLRFAIDTGAPVVVSADLARMLAPEAQSTTVKPGMTAIDGEGFEVALEPTRLGRLAIGPLELDGLVAAAVDAPGFGKLCPPLDGMLGSYEISGVSGFLDHLAVAIDLDERVATFSSAPTREDAEGVVVPTIRVFTSPKGKSIRTNAVVVQAIIAGTTVPVRVDTGDSGYPSMSLAFFRSLGRNVSGPDVKQILGSRGAGITLKERMDTTWLAYVDGIRLGSLTLDAVLFQITEHFDGEPTSVTLSQGFMDRLNFTLDLPRDRIILRPRRNPVPPDRPPTLGFDVRGGVPIVVMLVKDGVAASAGVSLGDEILEWDGKPLDPGDHRAICDLRFAICELRDRINSRDGSAHRLVLRRDGRGRFEVELPLDESALRESSREP